MSTGNKKKKEIKIPPGYPTEMGIERDTKRAFRLGGHQFDTMQNNSDFLNENPERESHLYMAKNIALIQRHFDRWAETIPSIIGLKNCFFRGQPAGGHD